MRMDASEVIARAGGAAVIAKGLGITVQAVSAWERIPAARCLAVEALSNGGVTRYQMRPDIFGEAPADEVAA